MKLNSKPKQKMQSVSFRNVDEFLEFLPADELKVVSFLRKIIFDCIPNVSEKLSYNVPFYKVNKNILFIWPASILWGTKKSYTGVRIGFTSGYLLHDDLNYLDKANRKQIYMKDFLKIKDIDIDYLKALIFEAVLIDKQQNKKQNGIQRKTRRQNS